MTKTAGTCNILALSVVALLSCQSEESTDESRAQAIAQKTQIPRMLGKAYYNSQKSIQTSGDFIREYPNEKDLCAGVLFNMARLYGKQGEKQKAIDAYQKAIDEYGNEIVPDVNTRFTVRDWALFRIGRLERDIGNRDKALGIFEKLMKSSDFNTRTSSRIEYLATKQSHLKATAKVTVQGSEGFTVGGRIPIVVSVHNPTDESVTFKCYGQIDYRSYRALAPREGCEEITLAPRAICDIPMVFTEKDTKGLVPGVYQVKTSLTGVPFATSSEFVEIRE